MITKRGFLGLTAALVAAPVLAHHETAHHEEKAPRPVPKPASDLDAYERALHDVGSAHTHSISTSASAAHIHTIDGRPLARWQA